MKRFLFSFLLFTACASAEVVEKQTTTTQQETTTTTQQETTTSTQQETTTSTILVNVNVDPSKFCEENPDHQQCEGYGSENNTGYGNMQDSGGVSVNDGPPLLQNLLIVNWGPYDSSSGISGDFEFRSELQLVFFDEFGRVHSAGTPREYDNPTFEYKVPRDTLVYIPIDGIIDFFQFQPTTSYKQDDWELMIKPSRSSDWAVVIDHVVSLSCDRSSKEVCANPVTINGVEIYSGMEVSAGDLLGYVGNYEDGEGGSVFGRTEISIGKYIKNGNQRDFNNFCPTNYLDPTVKANLQSSITQIMASYESWLGDSSFYNESDMVAPGCWYSEIYESQGKTTPTK